MADPTELMQHVSLGLGVVTAATVAEVQQATVGMFLCLLQGVEFMQHFVFVFVALVYYYFDVTYLELMPMMLVHMVQSSLEMILSPLYCLPCHVACWVILVFLVWV